MPSPRGIPFRWEKITSKEDKLSIRCEPKWTGDAEFLRRRVLCCFKKEEGQWLTTAPHPD